MSMIKTFDGIVNPDLASKSVQKNKILII